MTRKLLGKCRRFWRRLFGHALHLAPKAVRLKFYQHCLVSIPRRLPADLIIKIADTVDEREQAFALLHNCYVEVGFAKPHPSGMRVTAHQTLPSTDIVIAKLGNQVVGTVSIVRDGDHGLPLEHAFNVASARHSSQDCCEISCLAISKQYRRSHGGVIFYPLVRFLFQYCIHSAHLSRFLIAVSPKDSDMYEAIFGFQVIAGAYSANYYGAPAVGLYLDLQQQLSSLHRWQNSHPKPLLIPADKRVQCYAASNEEVPNLLFPDRAREPIPVLLMPHGHDLCHAAS